MASYLIHQLRDGTPVGVWTENDHYYFPLMENHEQYGIEAVEESRGSSVEWEDWIDQLAGKSPSVTSMFDIYTHAVAPLSTVLTDARAEST